MTSFATFTAVLLAYCIAVCASDPTTADQFREEVRRQLNEVEFCEPPNCTATYVADLVTESIKAAVGKCVGELVPSALSLLLTPGVTPGHPASSCQEIFKQHPRSPSGFYWIWGANNRPQRVHCQWSCNGTDGGWMRVASIDMTDPSSTCPSGLRTLQSPRRLCAINSDEAGCSSAVFPVYGVQYSRVCGKIIGYQQSSTDSFHRFIEGQTTVDSNYVDGISLTYGQHPRNHIWTFTAAQHEHNSLSRSVCPCTNTRAGQTAAVPDFVGNDYFCDTGSEDEWRHIFYGDDPLWDGEGCGQFSTCCSFNSPPWFKKQICPPTTGAIEARLCSDQSRDDEDINFEILEIYVQ
jgi:hypothetical protein